MTSSRTTLPKALRSCSLDSECRSNDYYPSLSSVPLDLKQFQHRDTMRMRGKEQGGSIRHTSLIPQMVEANSIAVY